MKKKIIVIFIIISLITIGILIYKNNDNNTDDISKLNVTNKNDTNIINQLKNEINATADTSIYQVEDEYDGRHTIQIKPNIQFETVLAGILKEDIPEENELNSLLNNMPNKKGIWISNKSRNNFLNILKENSLNNYDIDNDGYLYQKEESDNANSNILNNVIKSDQLYIIDISGTCYVRDDLSGDIVEYPFERMDPYQVLEVYKDENKVIFEITTNTKLKLTNQEILETILLNMN